MPTTQPATYTPCPPQRKAPRKALAPKKKKDKKNKLRANIETVKRSLQYAFNEDHVEKK